MAHGCTLKLIIVLLACLAFSGCKRAPREASTPREAQAPPSGSQTTTQAKTEAAVFAGSGECRDCHEKPHRKWATSFHGLAMRPFTAKLAAEQLEPQLREIAIDDRRYVVKFDGVGGVVHESGPDGEKSYPIEHALGGKNVFYFLTPWHRGRLQVLPVAFDVRSREWFDTTGSMIRHFADAEDEALDWKTRQFTFNTSCYSCHVSQLSKNYDLATDEYRTTWLEPGINCETCHGPAGEHIRVCRKAGDTPMDDWKINGLHDLTASQTNSMCAPCHAKMNPLTAAYPSGGRFFDHYDLGALEDPDFYPDGRDLGENYTYTLWMLSPCVASGQLDCLHCHTSSGRYLHTVAQANDACLPCHEDNVADAAGHSHHAANTDGSRCVSCHMPMTTFARMRRHDHMMLPPAPAATLSFGSPNACNICHTDQDAAWADKFVREWRDRDYQAPILHRAALIDAARKEQWARLPDMLAYLQDPKHSEVFAASLIRLLAACDADERWPAIIRAIDDPSPLVRSSAAAALGSEPSASAYKTLVAALDDEYGVVRMRAAASLAAYPEARLDVKNKARLERAFTEYEASLIGRVDDSAAHYNLGNYYLNRGMLEKAVAAFETASKLEPGFVQPLVNASIAYARLGHTAQAEATLLRALDVEPASAAAHFNLALLLSEQGRAERAEAAFRQALENDPTLAEAAYNLGVLLSRDRMSEAVDWCRKASELRSDQPKYAYALAFFLKQSGETESAIDVLRPAVDRHPAFADGYMLLGIIYEDLGRFDEARGLYRDALVADGLSAEVRQSFSDRLRAMPPP